MNTAMDSGNSTGETLFQKAVLFLENGGRASTPALQRELHISYGTVARLMEALEAKGVVAPSDGMNNARTVLIPQKVINQEATTTLKIYLDIDGTMIHEDVERIGNPAEGLAEFITALRSYDVYWLTAHCKDGNPISARRFMKTWLPAHLHPDIDRIKPTIWYKLKTEAIDFSDKFIWFDNDVFVLDRDVLYKKALGDQQWLVEVDLVANPKRLIEIRQEYL
jgi:DNA-binding MarR family transcriptional regulator